jgi:hypothetical protein
MHALLATQETPLRKSSARSEKAGAATGWKDHRRPFDRSPNRPPTAVQAPTPEHDTARRGRSARAAADTAAHALADEHDTPRRERSARAVADQTPSSNTTIPKHRR